MKKIIAILAALSLIASLAACGAKTDDETTTEPTSEDIVTTEAPTESDTEAPEESTDEADTSKEDESKEDDSKEDASKEDESKEDKSEKESTTEAKKAPQSKEEIVAYFNESVNKIKTDAKSVTKNYSKIKLNGSMTLPSAINGVLRLLGGADEFVGGQLEKNSQTSPETFTGAQIKAKYPVEGESYGSKLTAADVKSATCTESNGKYTITITTVADAKSATVAHGQGHAPKAFNVPLPGTINENIPGVATGIVGTASMNYPSSTAKIVVDAETGNVLTADYDIYWTINFDKAGVIIPFVTSDSYTVNF